MSMYAPTTYGCSYLSLASCDQDAPTGAATTGSPSTVILL